MKLKQLMQLLGPLQESGSHLEVNIYSFDEQRNIPIEAVRVTQDCSGPLSIEIVEGA